MAEDRGASSVVGVILVVGVAVILAATVSVLALGLVEEEDPKPTAAFEWGEYDANHGVLEWSHVSGANLEADRLIDTGGAVRERNTDYEIKAGEVAGTVFARPGDTVRVVEIEGETRHVIAKHEVPDNRPLKPINWSVSGPDPVQEFRSNFLVTPVQNADELPWEGKSDHIQVGDNQSASSFVVYSTTVPENSGNVTVEMRFETESFQNSRYWFYLTNKSGELTTIGCENLGCPNGPQPINGTVQQTFTTSDSFGALTLALDMNSPLNRDEVAKFYNLTVKTN